MIHNFVAVLREKIREEMNNYADDVATGTCADYGADKEICGVIRGLAIAEMHLLTLAEKLEKDDE